MCPQGGKEEAMTAHTVVVAASVVHALSCREAHNKEGGLIKGGTPMTATSTEDVTEVFDGLHKAHEELRTHDCLTW